MNDREMEAASLAMAAAIALCLKNHVDPADLLEVVKREVFTPGGFAYKEGRV